MAATAFPEVESTTRTQHPERNLRRTTLPNGLLVLTESMPHMRSVAMGAWVRQGSRDEIASENGLAHFVEHMVFKGTTSRAAQQIAREVDSIGGNLDAFTSKESVGFTIKVIDENVAPALDVLSDLVLHPQFSVEDLAREQSVILEEIKMDEDSPDSVVHETWLQNFWPRHPLGRPILGTAATVSSFTQRTVFDHHTRHFSPVNMVVSAAGNLDHDRMVARIERHFGTLAGGAVDATSPEPPPIAKPHITLKKKKSLEQVQLCLGMPGLPTASPDRFALYLLNTILGGGMSSRLFQAIREDAGLAYSIFSELSPFRDCGTLAVYAGVSAEKAAEALRLTLAEFTRLKNEAVPEPELKRAQDQMKSNIVLGMESSGSRMSNLARQQMNFGRFIPIDEIEAEIDRVTPDDMLRLARRLFVPDGLALTLLGNLGEMKFSRDDLAC